MVTFTATGFTHGPFEDITLEINVYPDLIYYPPFNSKEMEIILQAFQKEIKLQAEKSYLIAEAFEVCEKPEDTTIGFLIKYDEGYLENEISTISYDHVPRHTQNRKYLFPCQVYDV